MVQVTTATDKTRHVLLTVLCVLWTAVGLHAQALSNTIVVDSSWFDTASNALAVSWTYDGGVLALPAGSQYGYSFGADSESVADAEPSVYNSVGLDDIDTVFIRLNDNILFETRYFVSLRVRSSAGDPWSDWSEQASASVVTGPFSWEPIVYFRAITGDTVRAFNGQVALWFDGEWELRENKDTLEVFTPPVAPEGFIPVSVAFEARKKLDGPPLTFGVVPSEIPSGYTLDDVRVYRYTGGVWAVYHDYTQLDSLGMLAVDVRLVSSGAMALMIDTVAPQMVVLSDTTAVRESGKSVRDTFAIADNASSVKLVFRAGRGDDSARVVTTTELSGLVDTIVTTINESYVTDGNGARAYAVVTDGRHVDTINVSRQVVRELASDIATEVLAWVPLRTTAVLDDSSMAPVIDSMTAGTGYNNMIARVYRWFDSATTTDVASGPHYWVEYSEEKEDLFDLTPGKLMWIKTSGVERLEFGSGVTVSLRQPVALTVPAGEWADFALPFRFNMRIGDIVDATGAVGDSLQFHRWVRSGKLYSTAPLYIGTLPIDSLHESSAELSFDIRDGYSVFNPLSHDVTLKIPPVCAAMSLYLPPDTTAPKARVRHASDEWGLIATGRLAGNTVVSRCVLGYVPSTGPAASWYEKGPTFAPAGVVPFDPDAHRSYAHVVRHRTADDCLTFDLMFWNNDDVPHEVTVDIERLHVLPQNWEAFFVDERSRVLGDADEGLSVTVQPGTVTFKALAVGPAGAVRGAALEMKPFAGFRLMAQARTRSVTLLFGLPSGISRVEYAVHDTRGRLIWRASQLSGIVAGTNTFSWDCTVGRTPLAAGSYLLTVRALDADGKVRGVREGSFVLAQ